MSKTNNIVFKGLKVVAWIIFVALGIEAGALIVNFFFSLYNPEFVQNLYQKLDLSKVYERSQFLFFSIYSFILFIAILKAYLFYLVVMLVTKIDLEKPFNSFVAKQISRISYFTLSIGFISYLALQTALRLRYDEFEIDMINEFSNESRTFILMGAVIYIIAVIFSKGVEYQNELEETV